MHSILTASETAGIMLVLRDATDVLHHRCSMAWLRARINEFEATRRSLKLWLERKAPLCRRVRTPKRLL